MRIYKNKYENIAYKIYNNSQVNPDGNTLSSKVCVALCSELIHFWPMFPLYTPLKHQKTKGGVKFLGAM